MPLTSQAEIRLLVCKWVCLIIRDVTASPARKKPAIGSVETSCADCAGVRVFDGLTRVLHMLAVVHADRPVESATEELKSVRNTGS
jgi:hypothetical protein